jgi:hypothetical protein
MKHFAGSHRRTRFLVVVSIATVLGACGGSATTVTTASESPTATTLGGEQQETTSAPVTNVAAGDSATTTTGALEALRGDLPPPCSYVDAAAMSTILGVEVTAEESFATDCFYEPVAGYGAGLDAHTGAFAVSEQECGYFLQTEPALPGEAVDPAPEYGELASVITTEYSTEIVACVAGAAISVSVSGVESGNEQQRLAAAQAILADMISKL